MGVEELEAPVTPGKGTILELARVALWNGFLPISWNTAKTWVYDVHVIDT